MYTGWRVTCLVLLASVWGLSELIGGETIWLTAMALFLLAAARALVNRPGSSTLMGGIAVLFKSVNAAPFLCHLVGIALLGVAFDLTATILLRSDRRPLLRAALTGASTAYLSCFLFAASMVWIIEYKFWAGGGLNDVVAHTLTSGSRGALAALVLVPVGLFSGRLAARQAEGQPRPVLGAAAGACLALWVVGPFVR